MRLPPGSGGLSNWPVRARGGQTSGPLGAPGGSGQPGLGPHLPARRQEVPESLSPGAGEAAAEPVWDRASVFQPLRNGNRFPRPHRHCPRCESPGRRGDVVVRPGLSLSSGAPSAVPSSPVPQNIPQNIPHQPWTSCRRSASEEGQESRWHCNPQLRGVTPAAQTGPQARSTSCGSSRAPTKCGGERYAPRGRPSAN